MIIGVVVLVILLGGGFMMMNRSQTTFPTGTESATSETTTETNGPQMPKMSLKSLMQGSTTQTCTFSDATAKSSGTVYVGGGKMRGDFSSEVNSKPSVSHVMSDGTTMYMWTDSTKSGFKVSLSAMEKLTDNAQLQQQMQQAMDVNKQVDYSCSPWSVDASVFTAPTTVAFQDYSKMMEDASRMMKSVTGTMMPNSQAACSACDSLTGDAQTQCKAALKCK